MNNENVDLKISELLDKVRPELTPELEERAVSAISAAQSSAPRSRRRLIAIVVGAAVVLFGLGFVPFSIGRSKGALDRAIAVAEHTKSVHISSWSRSPDKKIFFENEEWITTDGLFSRREGWHNDKPSYLTMDIGPRHLIYHGNSSDAIEIYNPCNLHPLSPPERNLLERKLESFLQHAADSEHSDPGITMREYRDTSLLGDTVDVVEAQLITTADHWCCGMEGHDANNMPKGTPKLIRAEMDPVTGLLLSCRTYFLISGKWQQTKEETYEWDAEIPDDIKKFELPKGTKLIRYNWWEGRAEKILAQAETSDWTVTLHSIDINRNGNILLSLSRVKISDNKMPRGSGVPFVVEARGNWGEQYQQSPKFNCYNARYTGYWTTTLIPQNSEAKPQNITFTIWPYPEDPCKDQSVTFKNIPLPPRQNVDDVMAAAIEVIQY